MKCRQCNIDKDESNFSTSYSKIVGKYYIAKICKECVNKNFKLKYFKKKVKGDWVYNIYNYVKNTKKFSDEEMENVLKFLKNVDKLSGGNKF